MYLAWQQGILGDVCSTRVIVEWKKEEPDDADEDTQKGEVRR
jgi:hypothetical protein